MLIINIYTVVCQRLLPICDISSRRLRFTKGAVTLQGGASVSARVWWDCRLRHNAVR